MKLFSLMVLLCASLGGYAQDIKGRVVEQENGKNGRFAGGQCLLGRNDRRCSDGC